MRQAVRLTLMGSIDMVLAVLFGIYGDGWLRHSAVLLAIFIVWLVYNLYEFFFSADYL